MRSQEREDICDRAGRELQAALEHSAKLGKDDFTRDQVVLGKHYPQHIRTETARGERRNQDIGVEEHPHETSRNTSSSVR